MIIEFAPLFAARGSIFYCGKNNGVVTAHIRRNHQRERNLMSTKRTILLGLKIISLTIILFVCFTVGSAVADLRSDSDGTRTEPVGSTVLPLLMVCLLDTTVLAYLILRSRWGGWRLTAAIFLSFYGVMTVMSQIESAVFLSHVLPPDFIPKIFVMGAIVAGLFSPLAVLVLGKIRQEKASQVARPRLTITTF